MCAYIIALYFLTQSMDSEAVSTAEGLEFVIATPPIIKLDNVLEGFPKLVLVLESRQNSTVKVKTEWLNSVKSVDETVHITALIPTVVSHEKVFYSSAYVHGVLWSYHLIGTQPFSLLVSLETDWTSAETFMALPVPGWGKKYLVVTLKGYFSVVILAGESDTTVQLHLRLKNTAGTVLLNNELYNNGNKFDITLQRYQAYGLSNCEHNVSSESITGSSLKSDTPFGVVTGNCHPSTELERCINTSTTDIDKIISGNTIAEMLLPLETLGKSFIMFKATGRRWPGYYIIMSSSVEYTILTIASSVSDRETHRLMRIGDWLKRAADFKHIQASKPIQVMYVQSSRCNREGDGLDPGDPSLLLMVPVELFNDIYYCIVPELNMRHFVTIVVRVEFRDAIHLNVCPGKNPQKIELVDNNSSVIFVPRLLVKWLVMEYEVERDVTMILYSRKTKFGCYLHGVSAEDTYMHSAGFISSNINTETCVKSQSSMPATDLTDNDCDGWLDEEKLSDKDHDGRGEKYENIDEDLGYFYMDMDENENSLPSDKEDIFASFTCHSDFAEWSGWTCTRSCEIRDKIRTRKCLRIRSPVGCFGLSEEMKPAQCFANMCPRDCQRKTFGEDCKYSCAKCQSSCDKFNGSCKECFPGFDFPETGCQLDHRVFKEWNDWHCSENCQSPFLVRERFCKTTEVHCQVPKIDTKAGDCYVNVQCPESCDDYRWGTNCAGTCSNCQEPCNKFTGVCQNCKPGFQDEKNSCVSPCEEFQYGAGCKGNCSRKCGEDCLERAFGECRSQQLLPSWAIFLLLVLILMSICLCYFFKRKSGDEMYSMNPKVSRPHFTDNLKNRK